MSTRVAPSAPLGTAFASTVADAQRALALGADAIGGKAFALARLTTAGERVPAWGVIPADAFATQLRASGIFDAVARELASLAAVTDDGATGRRATRETAARLARMLEDLHPSHSLTAEIGGLARTLGPETYAVRSSAVGEDAAAHSFAGQFDTVLDVAEEGLGAAIATCWRSALSERALDYRRRAGSLDGALRMAVIVQRLVHGDCSGVLFTVDPVSGDASRMRVSACRGRGDRLVGGEESGDEYLLTPDGAVVASSPAGDVPILDDTVLRELAAMGRRIAVAEGSPRDIEWTIADGGLFILQSRPITTPVAKPERAEGPRIVWDNSNIQESYFGVTTPLTFSFASAAYASVYEQTMRSVGIPERVIAAHQPVLRSLLGMLRGRVYYNLNNWYRGLLLLPSFGRNKADMERMMGVEEPVAFVDDRPLSSWERLRALPQLARTAARLLYAFTRLDRDVPRFLEEFDASIAAVDRATLADRSLSGLMDAIERLRVSCLDRWTTPIINDFFVMMATGRLRRIIERAIAGGGESHLHELLGGAQVEIAAGPATLLLAMARVAAGDARVRAALEAPSPAAGLLVAGESSPAFATAYDELVGRFGDRCMGELKLESRPLRDDPAFVVRMIRNYLTAAPHDPRAVAEAGEVRRQAVEAEVLARLGWWNRRRFHRALGAARRGIRARETMRLARTRLFGTYRDVYTAIGRRLHERGTLDRPDDVLYLTTGEIRSWWDGTYAGGSLGAVARSRRAEFAAFAGERLPNRIVTVGPPDDSALASIVAPAAPAPEAGRVLRGLACSAGVAEGPVRVVRSPQDDLTLDGHILVAARTDPGWAPLFPSARAIIVERGSLLSHSAVLARELGIPAVVGIPGVVDLLRDGERVRVDGRTGTVERLDLP